MVTSFNKTLASNRCLLLRSPGWSGWKLTATSPRPVSSGAWGFMCVFNCFHLFISISPPFHILLTSISYPVYINFISFISFHFISILSPFHSDSIHWRVTKKNRRPFMLQTSGSWTYDYLWLAYHRLLPIVAEDLQIANWKPWPIQVDDLPIKSWRVPTDCLKP